MRRNLPLAGLLVAASLLLCVPDAAAQVDCPEPPDQFDYDFIQNELWVFWDNPAGCIITAYELQVGSSPGTSNVHRRQFPSPPETPRMSYRVGPIPTSGIYYMRLVAFSFNLRSEPSHEVRVVAGPPPPCTGVPPTPLFFFAFAGFGSTVSLSWTPGIPLLGEPCSASFRVLADRAPGTPVANVAARIDVGAISPAAINIAESGVWYLRLVAFSAAGESPPTPEISVFVQPSIPFPSFCPPEVPANLTATVGAIAAIEGYPVTLTWSTNGLPPNCPSPRYRLEAGLSPGETRWTFDLGFASRPLLLFAPVGKFYIRVVALNGAGGFFGGDATSNEALIEVPPK